MNIDEKLAQARIQAKNYGLLYGAYADYKVCETKMKITFAEAECWRTQQANNRYMDQAHR